MKKAAKITSLIFNLLVVLGVAFGTANLILGFLSGTPIDIKNPSEVLAMVTDPQNLFAWFAGFAALIMVFVQIGALAKHKNTLASFPLWLKFVSLFGLFSHTFIKVVEIQALNNWIIHMDELTALVGLSSGPIDVTLICFVTAPLVLGLFSFLFLEKAKRLRLWTIITTGIIPGLFVAAMLVLDYLGIFTVTDSRLSFMTLGGYAGEAWKAHAVLLAILLAASIILGLLVIAIHNANIKKKLARLKGQPVEETAAPAPAPSKKELKKAKKEKEVEPEPAPVVEEAPANKVVRVIKKTGDKKVIHVTKQPNGSWEVSYGDSERVEYYGSQAEAIRAASIPAQEFGYSIRVHTKAN